MDGFSCVVCGFKANWKRDYKISDEDEIWLKEYSRKGVFDVDSAKLERDQHISDQFWRSFYRLFMYDPCEQRYKLSGIGQRLTDDKYAHPPLERERAVAGQPTGTETDLARVKVLDINWSQHQYYDPKPNWQEVKVAVHMRCWTLVQQVIGIKVEENLGPFLTVLLMKAYESLPMWDSFSFDVELDNPQDPSRIPGIKDLVRKSKMRIQQPPITSTAPPESSLSYFPCEILYLILDHLDQKDCSNLLRATQIPVGDQYWRHRITPLLVGIDSLKIKDCDLDWQYFCLKLERQHQNSSRFRTRRRVLGVLEDLKAGFSQQLKKKEPVQIEGIVKHVQNLRWGSDQLDCTQK